MRLSLVLVCCLVGACMAANNRKYTNKYDNVDVDSILSNDRILANYIKCMLDEGPCTADGKELKKTLPDALAHGCEKCTDKQRTQSEKVFRHLTTKRPNDWNRLAKKFDPDGVYKRKYEEQFAKEKRQ